MKYNQIGTDGGQLPKLYVPILTSNIDELVSKLTLRPQRLSKYDT